MAINRKANIIEAAKKSFSLFGYKGTTMDQVANIANVGKGTIYTFFKNKEDLFHEILQSLIIEIKEVAEEAIHDDQSFFENLHRALYRVLDYRRKHELTLKLSQEVMEIGTPAAKEALRKVEEAVLAFIKKVIQQGLDKGELKKCNPDITAFIILKLYIALVYDWEKNHQPLDKDQIAQLFHLYLVDGLAKS